MYDYEKITRIPKTSKFYQFQPPIIGSNFGHTCRCSIFFRSYIGHQICFIFIITIWNLHIVYSLRKAAKFNEVQCQANFQKKK